MSESKIKIPQLLATRSLPEEAAERLAAHPVELEQKDFIEVSLLYDAKSFAQHLNDPRTQARVFTSKNAVYSLQELLADQELHIAAKKNFTVGIKATEMLVELGIETNARAENAISLAQIIARNTDVKAVNFFCGDQSLDDLPEYLESKRIKVHREVVYHTKMVYQQVDTLHLDGIIFLSPSAAFSFFKKNKPAPTIPAFCIGATTAEAVRLRSNQPRILADEPTLNGVIDKILETFSHEYH